MSWISVEQRLPTAHDLPVLISYGEHWPAFVAIHTAETLRVMIETEKFSHWFSIPIP